MLLQLEPVINECLVRQVRLRTDKSHCHLSWNPLTSHILLHISKSFHARAKSFYFLVFFSLSLSFDFLSFFSLSVLYTPSNMLSTFFFRFLASNLNLSFFFVLFSSSLALSDIHRLKCNLLSCFFSCEQWEYDARRKDRSSTYQTSQES